MRGKRIQRRRKTREKRSEREKGKKPRGRRVKGNKGGKRKREESIPEDALHHQINNEGESICDGGLSQSSASSSSSNSAY